MDVKSPQASTEFGNTIHIPSSPFMLKLGYGTGVSVYRYKRTPEKDGKFNSPWAIKKSNTRSSDNIKERLAVEASVLKQIGSHPFIVGFRAFTGTTAGDLCLAMEDCERSLMDMIEEKAFLEETFTANQILKVAWCISNALDFLHNTHKLLHGDLKSGNVLVRGDFEQVKLCDFGVSLRLKDDLSGLKNKDDIYIGSEPWRPKEAFNARAAITDKSDIYPFGLLLWEMLTLSIPHVDLLDFSSSMNSSIAELTGAELTGAELTGAELTGAELTGAELTGAELTGAELTSAELTGAELTGAELTGAELTGPVLTGTAGSDFSIEDNDEYLNALGTRPPIPNDFTMNDEYMHVVALFYSCTDEDQKIRPSASTIVASLQPIIEKREKLQA